MTEASERFATSATVTYEHPPNLLDPFTIKDTPPLTTEQARMLPFYHDLRNEIVQPDKVVVSTQYFWTTWAPRLGPTLAVLVMCLRRHCYYNRVTQERRDWCFPEQATLAREVGVETTKTIRAALQHPLAAYFVRREARYVYDPARAKKVRTSDMYYVAMDEPLIPEDEVLVTLRAAERLVSEGRGAENLEPSGGFTPPKRQNDRQVARQKTQLPDGQIDLQVERSTGRFTRQDSAVNFDPEDVPVRRTNTTTREAPALFNEVLKEFSNANAVNPTPSQIGRLHSLCDQFDRAARVSRPPATGADWVLAAIREAVESGSHFVAPRRIARICERWVAAGGPTAAEPAPASEALTQQVDRPEPRAAEPQPGLDKGNWNDRSGEMEASAIDSASPVLELLQSPSFVVFPELGLHSQPFWQTVCDEVRRRLGASPDAALLIGSRLLSRDEKVLTIGVPGRSAAERAELRLKKTLQDVTLLIVGRSVEICFQGYGDWVEGGR